MLPVTVTLNVQLPPAAREPPVREIVLVDAFVTRLFVPLHADVVEFGTESPLGSTSLKAIPDCATFPLAVLLIVNVNVDVAPLRMGFDTKDFVRVGAGAGMRHPLKITLSIAKRELLFCEPVAEILK